MPKITLYPVEDLYTDSQRPDTNTINTAELYAGSNYRYATFYQFDISEAIPYKKINDASFSYFYARNLNNKDFATRIGYYKTDRAAKTLTHANYTKYGTIVRYTIDEDWYVTPGSWYTRPVQEFMAAYKNMGFFTLIHFGVNNQEGIHTAASSKSENKPYLTIEYEDLPPRPPASLSPAGNELRNSKSSISLSWQFLKNAFEGDETQVAPLEDIQVSSALRYRVGNGVWTEIKINNNLNAYAFPPGTFSATPTGTIQWQAKTQTKHNGESVYSATASFKLGDTPPQKPTPIYPVNMVTSGSILFEWKYQSFYDALPNGFDLRYKIDDNAWVTVSQKTTNSFYNLPAIASSSTVQWQVRTFGEFGEPGEYCDVVSFSTAGTPAKPSILNITNSARPTVTWSASSLQSWDVQIVKDATTLINMESLPYDSGFQYKVKPFLPDGQYVVRIRIKNEYGFHSDWAERAFNISTVKPRAAILAVIDNPFYGVKLIFNKQGEYSLIYRSDGSAYRCIGKTFDDYYEDFTVAPCRKYKYFVRSVTSGESFTDSGIIEGYANFDETSIASALTPSEMVLLKHNLNDDPIKDINFTNDVEFFYFLNRQYPVAEVGKRRGETRQFIFYIDDYAPLERLAYARTPLLLRDKRLGVAYGYITGRINARSSKHGGYTISFDFTRVDYPEEIDTDA